MLIFSVCGKRAAASSHPQESVYPACEKVSGETLNNDFSSSVKVKSCSKSISLKRDSYLLYARISTDNLCSFHLIEIADLYPYRGHPILAPRLSSAPTFCRRLFRFLLAFLTPEALGKACLYQKVPQRRILSFEQ